ncbi:hypothetical protein B0H13DRAFT_1851303 [Mycena leptocephala]|nr:hypothetical protein B0H13DRAFT_1851303 [Mycena leptocephala]
MFEAAVDIPQGEIKAYRLTITEVAGMSDRINQRLTFESLFCDTASTEAFTQLFIELLDTIAQVTGKQLKLAPFFPDDGQLRRRDSSESQFSRHVQTVGCRFSAQSCVEPGTSLPIGTDILEASNFNATDFAEFHGSSENFTDSTEQFQHSAIADNDFGLNSFSPTGEFLNFLDDPEFLSHLEMNTVGSYSLADLPPLPMPSSSRIPADQEIEVSRKKRTREPEVDEADIIEGGMGNRSYMVNFLTLLRDSQSEVLFVT